MASDASFLGESSPFLERVGIMSRLAQDEIPEVRLNSIEGLALLLRDSRFAAHVRPVLKRAVATDTDPDVVRAASSALEKSP